MHALDTIPRRLEISVYVEPPMLAPRNYWTKWNFVVGITFQGLV